MKQKAPLILLLLAWATLASPAQVSKKPQQPKIVVSTQLDRTAIWVGDTVRYSVKVQHEPEIDFVLDNLKKESLNLAPFVVRDVAVRHDSLGGNKNLMEVTLWLTTYETGPAELKIPPLILYYFTRAAGLAKTAETPAESFSVPPTRVGLRSTLTADNLRPRDSKDIWQVSSQTWIISFALGLSGMAFLALAWARRLWKRSRKEKPQRAHLTRRGKNKMFQDFLRKAHNIGRSTAEEQIRFYAEVSQFVRAYLSQGLEIDAAGLTPEELEAVLKNLGRDKLGVAARSILERCERVLYTPQGSELGKDWRDEVERDLRGLGESGLIRGAR